MDCNISWGVKFFCDIIHILKMSKIKNFERFSGKFKFEKKFNSSIWYFKRNFLFLFSDNRHTTLSLPMYLFVPNYNWPCNDLSYDFFFLLWWKENELWFGTLWILTICNTWNINLISYEKFWKFWYRDVREILICIFQPWNGFSTLT